MVFIRELAVLFAFSLQKIITVLGLRIHVYNIICSVFLLLRWTCFPYYIGPLIISYTMMSPDTCLSLSILTLFKLQDIEILENRSFFKEEKLEMSP